MNSFTECLKQITSLTKKNLQILRMLNDAFYTKKNHLVSIVDGEQYVIPSFLSLENKIDNLEANLQNILDAPKTGEAFTYYDGTTQKLELFGYSNTPPKVDINPPKSFTASINHIFKDFMTPQPVVKFDIGGISNNIKHVVVKKVAIKDPKLLDLILDEENHNITYGETDVAENGDIMRGYIEYGDLVKTLFNYENGVGYEDYDTIRRLPLRMDNPTGEYDILEIIDTWQDANLEEHYTIRLDRDLTYHIQNGTIMKNIVAGDFLVSYNDKVEMVVEDTNPVTRTLTVKILYGAYAELYDKSSGNIGMYRLKYHKVNQEAFDASKYIEVPLEEDGHVCIFIAPINDTTNTQASFGTGVYLYTDYLKTRIGDEDVSFKKYYEDNVNNIGDALYAITNMMNDDDQVEKLTGSEFITLSETKPILNTENITVYQINKHLNDSESVKNIRNLYSQKVHYKNELSDIEKKIDDINKILADSSFDDTDETREAYKSQLRELNSQRRELSQNITSVIQEISENANSSDTPIENAKYHIRGFIDTYVADNIEVIGVDVEYRYKNKNKFTGNAETINESYIYSDWNKMGSFMKSKVPDYDTITGQYKYKWDPNNESVNEPSFNQIDIPISQGENVDIRARFIYNLGWPLVSFRSAWSDILNIEFPEEFIKDIEILDIISENNDDIKKQQFMGILEKEGVLDHVYDMVKDMDLTYFHQPEHIASGFYTPERRIIPLSDQLMTMARTLADLQTEVNGATAQLVVTLSDGVQESTLLPGVMNTFRTRSYVDAVNEGSCQIMDMDRDPILQPGEANNELVQVPIAVSNIVINIYNPTEFTIKLHSLFPGDNTVELDDTLASSKFGYQNYIGGGFCTDGSTPISSNVDDYNYDNQGVRMLVLEDSDNSSILQRQNQFIYFRTKVDGKSLYREGPTDMQSVSNNDFNGKWPENLLSAGADCIYELEDCLRYMYKDADNNIYMGMASLYPHIGSIEDICAPAGSGYYELRSGECVQIPLNYVYWLSNTSGTTVQAPGDATQLAPKKPFENKISRAIAFDIRTSLFSDPVTYKLTVEAHYQDLQTFKASKVNKNSIRKQYSPTTIVNSSIVNSGKKRR